MLIKSFKKFIGVKTNVFSFSSKGKGLLDYHTVSNFTEELTEVKARLLFIIYEIFS